MSAPHEPLGLESASYSREFVLGVKLKLKSEFLGGRLRCGKCGSENVEGHRFCGMCGAALVAQDTPAAKVPVAAAPMAAAPVVGAAVVERGPAVSAAASQGRADRCV